LASFVKVKATVIEDDTGIKTEIPIILTDQGELSPVTDFLLHADLEGKSRTWMNRVINATQLLMQYMDSNKSGFTDPEQLFNTFAKRIYTGTIGEDGLDPSGLYWIPNSNQSNNQIISALTALTDWLANKQKVKSMNPLIKASPYIQRLNYAAWYRRKQHDFLGHIEDKSANQIINNVRSIKGRKISATSDGDAYAFNERDFARFYREGMGGANDPRVALRDKLCLLLMHGGGLRISEALSLWVTDVFENPDEPDSALVRVYHPEFGKAPENWRGRNGNTTRAAYLKEKHALIPRKQMQNTQYLGWKSTIVDNKNEMYIQVHWFPKVYGKLFMVLWKDYLKYLVSIERDHPYAFIAFSKNSQGNPYTQSAFNDNYKNGLQRIGLEPNKSLGFDPHGHRHAYGRRLEKAGLDPLIIKKCLHHSSLEAQTVYTDPNLSDVSNKLEIATKKLNRLEEKPSLAWEELVKYGFEDIDPEGYFSGSNPKLRK